MSLADLALLTDDELRASLTAHRFWLLVDRSTPSGCWSWIGATTRGGYGSFKFNDVTSSAHRIAYEYRHGAIPDGLEIDHLCSNRSCVNPAHLEPVTRLENVRRGNGAQRVVCPAGHKYDEANTYHCRGKRYCRTCRSARRRKVSM
jgi:hypothetical protein